MDTVQNYVGRGAYANTLPQSAQIEAEVRELATIRPDLIINERIFQVQFQLFDLLDDFVAIGYENGPIQAVGNLLHHWLATPITELSTGDEGHQLDNALLLVEFLGKLLQANLPQGGESQPNA